MKKVEILRVHQNDKCTTGFVIVNDKPFCFSLELPYRNNEHSISCIPEGVYQCVLKNSPKFGERYEVMNVPNRGDILIHQGNTADDTHGCILLGKSIDCHNDIIYSSLDAIKEFNRLIDDVSFELHIKKYER